jgi:hypothetical protein
MDGYKLRTQVLDEDERLVATIEKMIDEYDGETFLDVFAEDNDELCKVLRGFTLPQAIKWVKAIDEQRLAKIRDEVANMSDNELVALVGENSQGLRKVEVEREFRRIVGDDVYMGTRYLLAFSDRLIEKIGLEAYCDLRSDELIEQLEEIVEQELVENPLRLPEVAQ